MSTQNRAEAVIDLNAIEANIKFLMAKSGKPALAVVKADAYGHGLIPVAQRALKAGATWLGVALLDEAIALRESGINAPILAVALCWNGMNSSSKHAQQKRMDLSK